MIPSNPIARLSPGRILSGRCLQLMGGKSMCATIPSHFQQQPVVFHYHQYHSTALTQLPVRRRRKSVSHQISLDKKNDQLDDVSYKSSTTSASAMMDQAEFDEASTTFVNKIYQALEPLKKLNAGMFLTRGIEEDVGEFILIDLGPSAGQYNLQIDNENQVLAMQTPISGQNYYMLREGEWIGMDDGHNCEGLLVRDLIRQCQGVPQL